LTHFFWNLVQYQPFAFADAGNLNGDNMSLYLRRSNKDDPIYTEKVEILYRHVPGAVFPVIVAVMVYAGVAWNALPRQNILIWCFCNFLLNFGRYALYRRYRQARQPVQDPKKWFLRIVVPTYLAAALWGSSAFFLFPESLPHHLFLAFTIAGFTAGAVGIYSILPSVVIGFTLLAGTPLFIRFFQYDDSLHRGLVVIMPVYWAGLMMVMRQIHRAMTTSLKLNVDLEEARNMLEARVAQRTAALAENCEN